MKLDPIVHTERRSRALVALRLTLLLALSAALASTGSLRAAATTVKYTIIDLGDLGDPNPAQAQSAAYAINLHNQVVGAATTASGDTHAFLYSGGKMIDLGTLATPLGISGQSSAYGINDQGVVVGSSENSQGGVDPFYDETSVPGAQMVDILGLLPGAGTYGQALGINNSNEIVGSVGPPYFGPAFLYSIGGGFQHLPASYKFVGIDSLPLLLIEPTVATAINASGSIVGYGYDDFQLYVPSVPFISDGGTGPWSTGLLLPYPEEGMAYAINSTGTIVGSVGNQAVQFTDSKKGWKALGYLPSIGTPFSAALGINSAGQIVGYSDVATATHHAIIYQNGEMTDLNARIAKGQSGGFLTLSVATAINESGAIAGYGLRTVGGAYFAFLAIPSVPTPLP